MKDFAAPSASWAGLLPCSAPFIDQLNIGVLWYGYPGLGVAHFGKPIPTPFKRTIGFLQPLKENAEIPVLHALNVSKSLQSVNRGSQCDHTPYDTMVDIKMLSMVSFNGRQFNSEPPEIAVSEGSDSLTFNVQTKEHTQHVTTR